MGLPKLETCCFIFDLKTGNTIMGCLNAVLSFTMFVIMAVVASGFGTYETALDEQLKGSKNLALIELEAEMTGVYAMCIILVFMFLAKFTFDIIFVYGVVAERAGIIKAYFIMWIVFTILSMFTFFLNAHKFGAVTISSEVFYLGLNVYAVLLSYSYYKQLNYREDV